MFKIPNIVEADEAIEIMTPIQIEALYLVSLYIRNKKLFGGNQVCFTQKAKDIEPSHLINLEKELKSLGFEMTVSYEIPADSLSYDKYVSMKINVCPLNKEKEKKNIVKKIKNNF